MENCLNRHLKRFPTVAQPTVCKAIAAESQTPLWTEGNPEEHFLVEGKVHNLRLAIQRLHGLEIPPNAMFSFWKHVGRASRAKGYVRGRELREGCMIPNIGGGLCQLSNALYDAALKANFEIIERHAHTVIVPGSLAEQGRDATVFWNYVDLRFRSRAAFRIEAQLTGENLMLRFCTEKVPSTISGSLGHGERIEPANAKKLVARMHSPNSCVNCGHQNCFRSLKSNSSAE